MNSFSMSRGYPMSPPIAWLGGKRSILPEILIRFPLQYDRYIEVFGGSGVVLFGKEPGPFETWNDYNSDLYNFYYCVKYKPLQLLQELRFLPFCSRNEFQIMKTFLQGEPLPNTDDEAEMALARKYFTAAEAEEFHAILTERCQLGDISRAAAFFKLNHMSYGATMTSFSAQPCDLRRFYFQISAAHERLINVILENKDFESVIRQYDRPGSFFYLDPPYFMAEDCYAVSFPHEDHQRLFQLLDNIQGKWLLSYNNCEFIRNLYKDYRQYCFTRINNLVQRYNGGAVYDEILISNFDMDERGNQNEQLRLTFD